MHARFIRMCLIVFAFFGGIALSGLPGFSAGSDDTASSRERDRAELAIGGTEALPTDEPTPEESAPGFAMSPKRAAAIRKRTSRYGLSWPHVNMLTSRWGVRRRGFHHGIDILCAPSGGEYIYVANDGVVLVAGTLPIYGRAVIVQHPNRTKTLYGHMSRLSVTKGQWVNRGNVLGRCGSTGRSTNPHLHFEFYVNGRPVDPLPKLPSWGKP